MQYEVQGKKASMNEWHVSLALDKLRYDYIFQYVLDGGNQRRGGVVIDFLVQIPPKPVPLEVDGDYWHSGERTIATRLKQAKYASKGWLGRPATVKGSETNTVEDAEIAVRRVLNA